MNIDQLEEANKVVAQWREKLEGFLKPHTPGACDKKCRKTKKSLC